MRIEIEFVTKAIDVVQETNRFMDTKAGTIAAFESVLLVVVFSNLINVSTVELVQTLVRRVATAYVLFLAVYFICYLIALVVHILLTLRVLYPQESPKEHVDFDGFEPTELFFLYELDKKQRMRPSVLGYSTKLTNMSDDDFIKEYVFELLKVSYIRKRKSDRLRFSLRLLGVLVVGLVVFCFLLAPVILIH